MLSNESGFTATIIKDDNDDTILNFPIQVFDLLGWGEGDILRVQEIAGRVVISKE